MFARFGLPQVIVTDNGICFTSSGLAQFVECNKIHAQISPYYPSSNGLAERAIQTFTYDTWNKDCYHNTNCFLLHYNTNCLHYKLTPHSTIGVVPAELLLKQKPHSCTHVFCASQHQGHSVAATGNADYGI